MKVFITGATGFLGSHLVELLVREGHQVRALVRRTSKTDLLDRLSVEKVTASLETGDGLDAAVEGVDAVVHAAGAVKARSREEFERTNAAGTAHLVDAARRRARIERFVYVSSLAAHGFSDDGRPRACDAEPRPLTEYGKSKLAGERIVLAAKDDLPVSVIRPPAIYGPRDIEMFAFFRIVSRRVMPFLGDPKNRLSLIYGPDCARAIYAMLTKPHPSGSVYFVDDGHVYTQEEFGRTVAEALGVRPMPVHVPSRILSAAAWASETYGRLRDQPVMLTRDKLNELRHPHLICSSEDIQRDLGWEPRVDLREGARLTVDWYREHGWL